MATTVGSLDSNGTLASWGEGPGGYYGQTFIAAGGALNQLQVTLAVQSGTTDYKVYITTWTGTKAGAILWESPLLLASTPGTVTVPIPNLLLTEGVKYAFILDTSVGVLGGLSAGAFAADDPVVAGYDGGYADGEFFYSPFEVGTPAANLAEPPIVLSLDLAFALTFSEFVNAPPIAAGDAVTVPENQARTGNVLANDSDPNGDALSVTGVSFGTATGTVGTALNGVYGTLTMQANGSFSYAANSDLVDTLESSAADVFTYQISDGHGGTATAQLTVTVTPADDERTINGGNGADILYGDRNGLVGAEDTIYGGNGADRIYGLLGADSLYGENGDDTIEGGGGADLLAGGQGSDRLTGGAGQDRFLFAKSGGADTITDFQPGIDEILLDGIALKGISRRDVDGDGILDAVLSFSSGSATLLGVGNADIAGDITGIAPAWTVGPSSFIGI